MKTTSTVLQAHAASLLVMRSSSPLEDRPLEHASSASSSAYSKLIYTASEVSQLSACPDVKDIEDDRGLLSGVAGVLAAVRDEVLLVGAEVHQANLSTEGKRAIHYAHNSDLLESLRLIATG